jgi:hypothetical protein
VARVALAEGVIGPGDDLPARALPGRGLAAGSGDAWPLGERTRLGDRLTGRPASVARRGSRDGGGGTGGDAGAKTAAPGPATALP